MLNEQELCAMGDSFREATSAYLTVALRRGDRIDWPRKVSAPSIHGENSQEWGETDMQAPTLPRFKPLPAVPVAA
jgi:hypothetical protein